MGREIKVNWATTSTSATNKTDTSSECIHNRNFILLFIWFFTQNTIKYLLVISHWILIRMLYMKLFHHLERFRKKTWMKTSDNIWFYLYREIKIAKFPDTQRSKGIWIISIFLRLIFLLSLGYCFIAFTNQNVSKQKGTKKKCLYLFSGCGNSYC
jgi:hypothetical protein